MTYTSVWPYLENICHDLQGTPPSAIMGQCGHYFNLIRHWQCINIEPKMTTQLCVLTLRWELSIQSARAPYCLGTYYCARKTEETDGRHPFIEFTHKRPGPTDESDTSPAFQKEISQNCFSLLHCTIILELSQHTFTVFSFEIEPWFQMQIGLCRYAKSCLSSGTNTIQASKLRLSIVQGRIQKPP